LSFLCWTNNSNICLKCANKSDKKTVIASSVKQQAERTEDIIEDKCTVNGVQLDEKQLDQYRSLIEMQRSIKEITKKEVLMVIRKIFEFKKKVCTPQEVLSKYSI
jgi:hypothetical protein